MDFPLCCLASTLFLYALVKRFVGRSQRRGISDKELDYESGVPRAPENVLYRTQLGNDSLIKRNNI